MGASSITEITKLDNLICKTFFDILSLDEKFKLDFDEFMKHCSLVLSTKFKQELKEYISTQNKKIQESFNLIIEKQKYVKRLSVSNKFEAFLTTYVTPPISFDRKSFVNVFKNTLYLLNDNLNEMILEECFEECFSYNKICNLYDTLKFIEENFEDLFNETYNEKEIYARANENFAQKKQNNIDTFRNSFKKLVQTLHNETLDLDKTFLENKREISTNQISHKVLSIKEFPKTIMLGENCNFLTPLTKLIFDSFLKYEIADDFDSDKIVSFLKTLKMTSKGIDSVDQNLEYTLPFSIPLTIKENTKIGSSNVIIKTKEEIIEDTLFIESMKDFILQYFDKFPTKYIQVCTVDGRMNSDISGLIGEIQKRIGKRQVFGGVKVNPRDIASALTDISEIVRQRLNDYGVSDFDIFSHNEKSQDNMQSFVFLLINDFPHNFNDEATDALLKIMTNGNKCGVYTILVHNTSFEIKQNYNDNRTFFEKLKTTLTLNHTHENEFDCYGHKVRIDLKTESFDIKEYMSELEASVQKTTSPIYLEKVFVPYTKKDPSVELSIPIGKEGSEVKFLKLRTDDSNCHVLISGSTGSGKTVLLHTLILSTAFNYSPEDVEFYLLDFKDGVEFTLYQNYLKIPHVKFIAVKNRIENAMDILKKLVDEKEKRNETFKGVQATNISAYNNSEEVKSGKLNKIPRIIVIIDEYQNMLEDNSKLGSECARILTDLAKTGRSTGISLVLSSQTVPTYNFSEISKQINIKFAFRNDEAVFNQIMPTIVNRRGELYQEDGRCFMESNQDISLIRVAFSEEVRKNNEHSMDKYAQKIREKYNKPIELIVAGETKSVFANEASTALFNTAQEKKNKEFYMTDIGLSFMSSSEITVDFKPSINNEVLLVGDRLKAKDVELSMILSLLKERQYDSTIFDSDKFIYYLNFPDLLSKNKIDVVEKYLNGLENFVEVSNKEDLISSSINEIYEIYLQRENGKSSISPVFLFINSAGNLSGLNQNDELSEVESFLYSTSKKSKSALEKVRTLAKFGRKRNIHVVMHFTESREIRQILEVKELQTTIFFDKKNIVSASNSFASFQNISTLVAMEELPDSCALLVTDYIMSKFRFFKYSNENTISKDLQNWNKKFIKSLKE